MSRDSGIPRWLKKLLLTVSTLGAAAVTFVLMRREGDRLTGLRDASVEKLKGRFSGKVVPRLGDKNPFAGTGGRSAGDRRETPADNLDRPVQPRPAPAAAEETPTPTAKAGPRAVPRPSDSPEPAELAEVATFPGKAEAPQVDPEPRRCAATTTSGTRCSREVGLDEEYCWQHGAE